MHDLVSHKPHSFTNPLRLSKSRFLAGLQCAKRLYLQIHAPELASEVDEQRQALFQAGTEVGELARRCFPGGRLVEEDYRHTGAALQRTAEFLQDPTVSSIFEGALEFQGTLVWVDILQRLDSEAWRLIEVKAASKVKSVYVDDLTIQAYVLRGAGVCLTGAFLMHINRDYEYPGGDIDLGQLFSFQDLTETVNIRQQAIAVQLEEMRKVLGASTPPTIAPDNHCHAPYPCQFWDFCTKNKPSRWIYYLPGGNDIVRRLSSQGVETIDEIPQEFRLTFLQRRIKENREWISPQLREALLSVRYPVHHLDFETFMPAIPLYARTRPYQPIPVQWSNHIESEDKTVRHDTCLCTDQRDPREELAVNVLASLDREGTICVYSQYERYLLMSLAQTIPTLKPQLERAIERLWDLLAIIQAHYYHPAFQGSFSIKSVLPALVPSIGYDDLEIQDGAVASVTHQRMLSSEIDLVERARLTTALLQYCERDTVGMLEIRRVLLAKTEQAGQGP